MSNPYAPPVAEVRDVTDPLAPTSLAGRGARLIASIVDSLMFGAIIYLPITVVIAMGGFDSTAAMIVAVLACAAMAVYLLITYRNVRANGQTIGKRMLGIKVVRTDGSAITVSRIFWMRNVLNYMISVIPLYGLVDVLFIFGEKQRCLHDYLSDTIVINA